MKSNLAGPVKVNLILLLQDAAEGARLAIREGKPEKIPQFLDLVTKITALLNVLEDLIDNE